MGAAKSLGQAKSWRNELFYDFWDYRSSYFKKILNNYYFFEIN